MTTTVKIELGYLHADKVVKVLRVGQGVESELAVLAKTGASYEGAVWDGSEIVLIEKDAPASDQVAV